MSSLYSLLATMLLVLLPGLVLADAESDVQKAVDAFYAGLADDDLEGIAHYIPERGFTEFNTDSSELKTFDLALFRRIFADGVGVAFKVEQPKIRIIHDETAFVTGYRVGAITFPDGRRVESRNCSSTFWAREEGRWLLQHVHLSNCPASP